MVFEGDLSMPVSTAHLIESGLVLPGSVFPRSGFCLSNLGVTGGSQNAAARDPVARRVKLRRESGVLMEVVKAAATKIDVGRWPSLTKSLVKTHCPGIVK